MEEEKKKFNKKWLIIIAILVLIAIIVVTIILCIPGNPKSAVEALKKEEKSGLLQNSTTQSLYDNFEQVVAESSISSYSQEMQDVETILLNIEVIVDKYTDYAIFFEENEYFYDNYKPLTNSLNEIQNYKSEIVSELETVKNEYNKDSSDFLRKSWINVRENFVNMLDKYCTAFSTYRDIFLNSYFGLEQNLASSLTVNAVSDYLSVIRDDFKDLAKKDTADKNFTDYSYSNRVITIAFDTFVTKTDQEISGDINNYYFDETISQKYEKINSFYSVYNQKNLYQVISSAYLNIDTITFVKVFEGITDNEGIYLALKEFLGGKNA